MNKKIIIVIIIYIIIASVIIIVKPKIIYDEKNKNFKKFGLGEDKSLITIETVLISLAIILGLISSFFDMDIINKKDGVVGGYYEKENELKFYKSLFEKLYVSNS